MKWDEVRNSHQELQKTLMEHSYTGCGHWGFSISFTKSCIISGKTYFICSASHKRQIICSFRAGWSNGVFKRRLLGTTHVAQRKWNASRASTGGENPSTVILSTALHRVGTTAICLRKHLGGLKRQLKPVSLWAEQSRSKMMIPAPKRLIQLNLISTCKRLLSSKSFLATKSPGTSVRLISMRWALCLPGGKRRHSEKGQDQSQGVMTWITLT